MKKWKDIALIQRNYLVTRSLRSCEGGECGSFFGVCPKNEPHSPFFASEASYGLSN
ncbi:MAG: hypothetical protein U5L45_04280 [Saprospiraceae bacterium]|nr:hypothetical protein [Saprospiraceae bacterium]